MSKVLVDSNIWLYALIQGQDLTKHQKANQLLNSLTDVVLSNQIIAEVSVNLLRKAKLQESQIKQITSSFYQSYTIHSLQEQDFLQASDIRQKYQYSFWDSLIIAIALAKKCNILYSEDMQHGQVIENQTQILNPFI